MTFLYALLIGYGAAFFGSTFPGMLNMTTVAMCLERGKRHGLLFAAGAATSIAIYAALGLSFAGYLDTNPAIFARLERVAVGIFLGLAVFFYWRSRRPKVGRASRRSGRAYPLGVVLAFMNVLALPYLFGVGTLSANKGWFSLDSGHVALFVTGAFLGASSVLSLYATFSGYIARRATVVARNINLILAGLFTLLAVIQLIRLYL